MLSINTNIGALRAADAAYSVNKSMETSMHRLSSGKRINSAADDAAGLKISQRQEAEIRGFAQSSRNAADAQAFFATAEGAMGEIHNLLQRLREIAVQSANDTNNTADRTALQTEVTQLEADIDRIRNDTTWAGILLLNGTSSGSNEFTFQVGPDSGDTIAHTIPDMLHTATTLSLNGNVSSRTDANAYITLVDTAIDNLGTEREQLGALMNRLDYTLSLIHI